jgi:hypothetical protein
MYINTKKTEISHNIQLLKQYFASRPELLKNAVVLVTFINWKQTVLLIS